MSHQYIHTSAKRGLEPGKSGFCCVARDRSAPLDLIQELERLSRYESVSGAISPIILRYEVCQLRSGAYHILSRIQDSGVDYSKRNNHIAQHLAFFPNEIPFLPDPMTILLCWKGWRDSWHELPRILELEDAFDINEIDTKSVIANHPNEFADLIVNGLTWKRTLTIDAGEELAAAAWIRLHLLHVPNEKKWQIPFSTYLLTTDNPDTFAWSCIWHGRELPYEVDTEGLPWEQPEIGEDNNSALEDSAFLNTQQTLKKLRKPNTPIVEIPKELTRRDRRRPKAKWTKSRFNSTMNLVLIAGMLICLGIAAYQFLSLKEPAEKLLISAKKQKLTPEEKAAIAEQERRKAKADATQNWIQLQSQRLLLERNQEASEIADTLADLGDPEPLSKLNFIGEAARHARARPFPSSSPLPISREYIKKLPGKVQLNAELTHYLSQLNLSLLPKELPQLMLELENLSISTVPIKNRLSSVSFVAEDIAIAAKEIRRKSRDTAITKDLNAWNSIIAFNELKQQIRTIDNQQNLLEIHKAFGLDNRDRFISYDEHGLLTTPDLLSYDRYLMSLVEKYMLPRYAKFEPNPDFNEALNSLAPDQSIRKSAYKAIMMGTPNNPQTQAEWRTISKRWRDLLAKDDLMQETLTNYAIEQLEENKRELAQNQNGFTLSQFQSFNTLKAINALLAQLDSVLSNTASIQEWVVIPQETTNAPELTTLQ